VVAKKYTEATLHTSHLQKSSESNVWNMHKASRKKVSLTPWTVA
jgi:hypothetical protein